MMYVFFRDDPSSHKEVYLARTATGGFVSVKSKGESNLQFDTAREAYDFAREFPRLQSWHVGSR